MDGSKEKAWEEAGVEEQIERVRQVLLDLTVRLTETYNTTESLSEWVLRNKEHVQRLV